MNLSKQKSYFVKPFAHFSEFLNNNNRFYIAMEKCKYSLHESKKLKIQFSEADMKRIIAEILQAMHILKQKQIVLSDVSPGNILLDVNDQITFCDFEFAYYCKHDFNLQDLPFIDPVPHVTIDYLSPELYYWFSNRFPFKITQICYDPFKSDIFSIGLSLLYVLGVNIKGLNVYEDYLDTKSDFKGIIYFELTKGHSFIESKGYTYTRLYDKVVNELQIKIDKAIESIKGFNSIKNVLKIMLKADIKARANTEDLLKETSPFISKLE
jgi:serine/threonine protein kinase